MKIQLSRTIVYVPTQHGDVNIERCKDDPKRCVLTLCKLTADERGAVGALFRKFKAVNPETGVRERLDLAQAKDVTVLDAPLEKVHALFVVKLHAGKNTITAVKLSNGQLAEVHAPEKQIPTGESVTVPVPYVSCPPIAIEPREVQARGVLRRFMNPAQRRDFAMDGSCIVFGNVTGRRYRVYHQYSIAREREQCGYLVRDIDRKLTLCTHQAPMPPAEQMLSLLVTLGLREQALLQ